VFSTKGGVDNLAEVLTQELKLEVVNLTISKKIPTNLDSQAVLLSSRIFDPALDYTKFEKIIFIQSQNLLASPDYLVTEEVSKNLGELFLAIDAKTEIYLDTSFNQLSFLENLKKLNFENVDKISLASWYLDFLQKESLSRQKYEFYPFTNLLLITSQEKTKARAVEILRNFKTELQTSLKDFEEIKLEEIYPARLLKRKGFFSYHLLIKFPRQYPKFLAFQKVILRIQKVYRVQIRLNPKHLF
jgi:hypothetical protein